MPRKPGEPWLLYVSRRESRTRVQAELARVLDAGEMKQIEIRTLPRDVLSIREHGLLYLPHPYVVPGGRFNEMYGWDSYFIQVGLLRDGEIARARDLVENFIYEIEHYGTILNANRTYYLSRSQPPFLTRMILGVYEQTGDTAWLRSTLPAIDSLLSLLDDRATCHRRCRAVAVFRSRKRSGAGGRGRREGRAGAHPLRSRA